MPKRKKINHSYSSKKIKSDNLLMLLAACAALIVGFFAIAAFKSQSQALISNRTPLSMAKVQLASLNNSNETGTATLQEVNGKVVVTLTMVGFTANSVQRAHIYVGSCANIGDIKYPLNDVNNGTSSTVLPVTLAQMKAIGQIAISVHFPYPQSTVHASCGNLSFNY